MRPPPGGGFAPLVDIAEVTAQVRAEGGDLSEDWTEVVLFGLRADQDTVQDPYDGEPAVPAYLGSGDCITGSGACRRALRCGWAKACTGCRASRCFAR